MGHRLFILEVPPGLGDGVRGRGKVARERLLWVLLGGGEGLRGWEPPGLDRPFSGASLLGVSAMQAGML